MDSRTSVRNFAYLVLVIAVGTFVGRTSSAAEPGWSPVIIATGDYRRQIESMPIEQRPYRPLHFYGNTVRRVHYRGNPLPLPKGLGQTLSPRRLLVGSGR